METSLSMNAYWRAVVRHAWLVAATVVITVSIAVFTVFRVPAEYSARVTMRVSTPGSISGESVRPDDSSYLERLQNTYAAIATSPPLRTALMTRLDLRKQPVIKVSGRPASELMDITAKAGSAQVAASAANNLALLLIDRVRELDVANVAALDSSARETIRNLQTAIAQARDERDVLAKTPAPSESVRTRIRELDSDIGIKSTAFSNEQANYQQRRGVLLARSSMLTIVTPAAIPTGSSLPGLAVVMAAAGGVGLMTGLALAALFERLRTRVGYRDEVEAAAGSRVIAYLPAPARIPGLVNAQTQEAYRYRDLRTEMLLLDPRIMRSLVVTAPIGTDGADWVAANLAVSLGRAGHRCAIVDAAIMAPSLHQMFDVNGHFGVAHVLCDEATLDEVTTGVSEPDVSLVPAGWVASGTGDVVTPARVAKMVAALEADFEMMIVHVPATPVGDLLSFASVMSAALLVVRLGQTSRSEVTEACEQLRSSGLPLLGVVLLDHKHWRQK